MSKVLVIYHSQQFGDTKSLAGALGLFVGSVFLRNIQFYLR